MSFQDDMIEYGYTDEEEFLEALEDRYTSRFGSLCEEEDDVLGVENGEI